MRIRYLMSLILAIFLCGCQSAPTEDYRQLPVEGVERMDIDFGSTPTTVVQTDTEEMKINLHLDDNGPGLQVDAKQRSISVSLGSDIKGYFRVTSQGLKYGFQHLMRGGW